MNAILLSGATFVSTLVGGLFGLRYASHRRLILGFTAGVIIGLVAFDLLPQIFRESRPSSGHTPFAMVSLVAGFLMFHVTEKVLMLHHGHEPEYAPHSHPAVGILSASALAGHSFLDGVGIGIGFKVSTSAGMAVAIAVITHDFADGLNTVILMLLNKNSRRRAMGMLLLDAAAPILGTAVATFFAIPTQWLGNYLGFFAGFLLYIGASDILPEAHSGHSSVATLALTVLGAAFAFAVAQAI